MRLEINPDGENYLIKIIGDVDLYSAPILKEAFRDAGESDHEDYHIDLAQVSYIDSSGIGALLYGAGIAKKNGGRVACVNARDEIKFLFKTVNLTQMFGIAG